MKVKPPRRFSEVVNGCYLDLSSYKARTVNKLSTAGWSQSDKSLCISASVHWSGRDAASGFPACLCALRPILCHQEPAVNLISWWRLRRQLPVLLLERRWSVDIAMVTGQTLHHRAAFVCESQSLGSALWEMSKVRTMLYTNAHMNVCSKHCKQSVPFCILDMLSCITVAVTNLST